MAFHLLALFLKVEVWPRRCKDGSFQWVEATLLMAITGQVGVEGGDLGQVSIWVHRAHFQLLCLPPVSPSITNVETPHNVDENLGTRGLIVNTVLSGGVVTGTLRE